jgi:metallophosphoesterase superfamily enzyme
MATKIYSSNGQRIRRRLSVYDRIVKKLVLLGDSKTEAQNKARDMFKLINIQSQVKFNEYAVS